MVIAKRWCLLKDNRTYFAINFAEITANFVIIYSFKRIIRAIIAKLCIKSIRGRNYGLE